MSVVADNVADLLTYVLFLLKGIFDDNFIDYLFDLVEQTRHMQDETLNYSLIKLIVRPTADLSASLSNVRPLGRIERAIHGRNAFTPFKKHQE